VCVAYFLSFKSLSQEWRVKHLFFPQMTCWLISKLCNKNSSQLVQLLENFLLKENYLATDTHTPSLSPNDGCFVAALYYYFFLGLHILSGLLISCYCRFIFQVKWHIWKGATFCPASREHCVQPSVNSASLLLNWFDLPLLFSPSLQWINGNTCHPVSSPIGSSLVGTK